MLKLLSWVAAFAFGLGAALPAFGQTLTTPAAVTLLSGGCGTITLTHGLLTVDANGVLCTAPAVASGTFNSTMTGVAALPTLAPGNVTPRGSLAGAAYSQPVYGSASGGGTQVDATHGLPVQSVDVTHCDHSVVYDASTNGKTEVVALASAQVVYVCGITFGTGGTATNVGLVSGTGTNCGTGEGAITPMFQLVANQTLSIESSMWNGLATTASKALCVKTSAGNPVQVLVKYTQK